MSFWNPLSWFRKEKKVVPSVRPSNPWPRPEPPKAHTPLRTAPLDPAVGYVPRSTRYTASPIPTHVQRNAHELEQQRKNKREAARLAAVEQEQDEARRRRRSNDDDQLLAGIAVGVAASAVLGRSDQDTDTFVRQEGKFDGGGSTITLDDKPDYSPPPAPTYTAPDPPAYDPPSYDPPSPSPEPSSSE
jgi:hypothetical protein